jgi:hypothetical protein
MIMVDNRKENETHVDKSFGSISDWLNQRPSLRIERSNLDDRFDKLSDRNTTINLQLSTPHIRPLLIDGIEVVRAKIDRESIRPPPSSSGRVRKLTLDQRS